MANASEPWDVARAIQTYNITRWGDGYFGVNDAGHMTVRPIQDQGPALDLTKVVEEARGRGLQFPLLLRFQDLLRHRVQVLNEAFQRSNRRGGLSGYLSRRFSDQGEPAARSGGGDYGRGRVLQVRA